MLRCRKFTLFSEMSANFAGGCGETVADNVVLASRAHLNELFLKVDKGGRDIITASLGAAGTNPWQTISTLQSTLSPGLSLFGAPLEFLLSTESSNVSVNTSVLENLKVQVENAVGKLDEDALRTMLPATIPLIHIKELRSIPIAVMKSMTTIPENCLRTLVSQGSISEFPLAVKRQAWKIDGAYFVRSIDEVLQEGTAVSTPSEVAARLEQHAARMCELIMDSRKLFEAFAQHCTDQTVAAQPPSQTRLQIQSAPAALSAITALAAENEFASQGNADAAPAGPGEISSSTASSATLKPPTASASARKYNFPGLLQRVLLGLQEGGKSVQSAEKLHDIAIILDRCKRQNRFDNASVASIFECIKLMIISREAAENTATRRLQPAPSTAPRAGKPGSNHRGPGSAVRQPASRNNIMSKLGLATKSSAPKVKVEKAAAPVVVKKASSKRPRDEVAAEEEADTSNSDSDDEGGAEISGREPKRARRVAAARADLRDLSDSSGGEERMEVIPKAGKTKKAPSQVKQEDGGTNMLQEALELAFDHMRRADPGGIFYYEITDAFFAGYSKICPKPMDLIKIERKLKNHRYRRAEDFDADVDLMVRNCRAFRGADDEYTQLGVKLQKIWKAMCKSAEVVSKPLTSATVPVRTTSAAQGASSSAAAAAPTPPVLGLTDLTPAMQSSVQRMQGLTDSGGDGDLLSEVLAAALEFLAGADNKVIFMKPVSDRDAPDYSAIIKSKMALSNMRTKQTRRDYSSLDEFSEDVELIASNCVTYNGAQSVYGQYAATFLQKWRLFLRLAAEKWPSITTAELRATLSASEAPIRASSSARDASADTQAASPSTPTPAGIAPGKEMPDEASGTYMQGGTNITLESILTAQDIRDCVQDLDVTGSKALKAIMNRVWEYLTGEDKPDDDGVSLFAAPSSDMDFLAATEQPMDLGIIKLAMKRNKYKTLEDFDQDIRLMLQNVFRYYEQDHETYWFAEQLQYAWYLSRQNIRSVLTGDASLEVEIDEEHRYVPEEAGEDQDEDEMEKEDAQDPAAQVAEVKADVLVKKERAEQPSSPGPAESKALTKGREESEAAAPAQIVSSKAKAVTPGRPGAAVSATTPVEGKTGTAEPMDVVEDASQKTKSLSAEKPRARAEIPNSAVATSKAEAKIKPESKKAVQESLPGRAKPVAASTSTAIVHVPVVKEAIDVVHPAGADPLRMLRAMRAAVARFRSPPVLLNGQILSAQQAAAAQGSSTSAGLPLPDLPPVPADSQLSWALVLLRDFSVQALLRKQFAMRLRDLVLTSSDVSGLTLDSRESSGAVSAGHFAPKFALPAADSLCRLLFQLCQMSLTFANRIDPVDERVLRVYIPRLVYCVLTRKPDAAPAEVKKEGDAGTADKLSTNGTSGAAAFASSSAPTKSLAVIAKEVLAEVFAQQPLDALAPAPGRMSCFSDSEVLRDFLESIAKHMINLKGAMQKRGFTVVKKRTESEEKILSPALAQALGHVKDFMTDSQKASIIAREGKIIMDAGDLRGAIECFNEGISLNPTVTLFSLRATAHKLLEMYTEAYFDYSYNIRLEPENGVHYCNRGLCLSKLKKVAMALEDFEVAIEFDPSPTHYYSRATTFADFGKYEQAIADYTLAIGDDSAGSIPSELKLRCKYRRAMSYFELQKYEEVVKDTNSILHSDPNSVQARALLGRALKVLNDHKKAEEQLSVAILLDVTQANLYIERGDIRFRTAQRIKVIEAIYDFDKAVSILEKKLEGRSGDNGARRNLARDSSKFNIAPKESDEGVMIDPSMLVTNHLQRKGSVLKISKSAKGGGFSTASGSQIGSSGDGPRASAQSGNFPTGAHVPAAYYREIEEQLADALFKRCQAKLMADPDQANVEAALADGLKALTLYSEDDDYFMAVATCYMRLNKYDEALHMLQQVLDRSPKNYKALYQHAFCQRASGSQKDAIEGLTKILAYCGTESGSIASSKLSMPIHRVYEMRGTMFHEIQAHKLALHDLGKAIAINPVGGDNYYLRGDCHSKLGNYEQALNDYDMAEQNRFEDKCALFVARGSVRRLLGQSEAAAGDFKQAYELLDKGDKVGRVRVLSFKAFCQIDQTAYRAAYDSLIVAQEYNREILVEKMRKYTSNIEEVEKMIHSYLKRHGNSWHSKPLSEIEGDILYLKRIDWILNYHCALCAYMMHDFAHARHLLTESLTEDMRKFIPDDISLGTQLFFLAQTHIHGKDYDAAHAVLAECGATHWVDRKRNSYIWHFALAKLFQCQGAHNEAIAEFNQAIDLCDGNPSHCYFRRAWSYKALGNYVAAGDDFETAKHCSPDDPNFAINYKSISQCAYMEIASDPDLVEPFPALLPVPGLNSSST